MILQRLQDHRDYAADVLRSAEGQINDNFTPLRRELRYHLKKNEGMLRRLHANYPHNVGWQMELPVGWMLQDLIEQRICMIQQALSRHMIYPVCTTSRSFCVESGELRSIFGTDDFSEAEVPHLLLSCAAHYIAAIGGMEDVTFSALVSMFNDEFHIKASIPVF